MNTTEQTHFDEQYSRHLRAFKLWGMKSSEIKGSVRLGKVVYSSGCEPRSSKAGQPLGRELWVGAGNRKDQAQGEQGNRP